ncbi:MAG: NAD(P)/FAD-dependent oxidoreductase, partial [Deltaproteobacteria bacterium]
LNATQVADEPFVSMGIVHTSATDYETHVFPTRNTYRKLVFSEDGEKLVGALFIGDISHAGLYRYVIRERMTVDKIKHFLINHTLHYGHLLLL